MSLAKPQKRTPEELGEMCIGYLAEHPEQLGEFMVQTGYDPAGLRRAVGTRQLTAGLIDHFAQNEPLMLALCANSGLRPEDFMAVWHRLNRTM